MRENEEMGWWLKGKYWVNRDDIKYEMRHVLKLMGVEGGKILLYPLRVSRWASELS